jgi:thiol-disulfide isomerase/thioredoxin
MFKPVVQQVSQETGIPVNFIDVDYDSVNTDRYKIQSIPTIIILDAAGNEKFRHTGVLGRNQLLNAFKS